MSGHRQVSKALLLYVACMIDVTRMIRERLGQEWVIALNRYAIFVERRGFRRAPLSHDECDVAGIPGLGLAANEPATA